MVHELKIEAPYFEAVLRGEKKFEIRKNDRGFQKGDIVVLKELSPKPPERFTGRAVEVEITYVTGFMQKENWVVFALKPL